MNTKVKIAVAAAIVVAIVGLVLVDQFTKPSSDAKAPGASAPAPTGPLFARNDSSSVAKNDEGETVLTPRKDPPAEKKEPIKGDGSEPKKTDTVKQTETGDAGSEEYVVKSGDTFASIAERKYGDSGLWKSIADANPGVDPRRLRDGQKIKVPVKPVQRTTEPSVQTEGDHRVYLVQAGDDLGKISKKMYNTSRYWERIFEANRDKLSHPDELQVDMKLTIPAIAPAKRETTTEPRTEETDLAGKRLHRVAPRDALWNIAEKYRGDRGVIEMIDGIVKANPEKLRNANTPLRVGWSLVIP